MAITADGQFINQLATGSPQVWPFRVGAAGVVTGLTPVADGQPQHGGQVGIATVDFE